MNSIKTSLQTALQYALRGDPAGGTQSTSDRHATVSRVISHPGCPGTLSRVEDLRQSSVAKAVHPGKQAAPKPEIKPPPPNDNHIPHSPVTDHRLERPSARSTAVDDAGNVQPPALADSISDERPDDHLNALLETQRRNYELRLRLLQQDLRAEVARGELLWGKNLVLGAELREAGTFEVLEESVYREEK